MKIKSISRTDEYKYIGFREIQCIPSRVLTPTGFANVKCFNLIKTGITKHLIFDNGMELKCDPMHRLRTYNGETKFVQDLNANDELDGINGPVKFIIQDGQISDLYDIEIDSPHWYYTSGVVSHNSIALINNAIDNSKRGHKILLITLELSDIKSAIRALGAMTERVVTVKSSRIEKKDELIQIAKTMKGNGAGDIVIHEFPPDEVSVDAIYALLDELKRSKNFIPDVIIIDYLELMISRRPSDNDKDYVKQKAVATQIRGLAKNTNTFVITATQTNRGGNDEADKDQNKKMTGVTNISESYGKAMPMDYLISINQTQEEYKKAQETGKANADLFIAKNRNGRKFISVTIEINYKSMKITGLNGTSS